MPELERWEEKAIGRVNRFENTDYEYATNQIYEGGRSLLNWIAQGTMNLGRGFVEAFGRPLDAHIVNGKDFTEYYGVGSRLVRRIGVSAANMAIDQGAATVDGYLTRKFFYPSGKAVADTAFAGRVTFDREMTREMFNDCGYAPDLQATMKRMYDTAAEVGKGLTDITWRREVTPHMIRTAYQQELETAFEAIRNQHRENPSFTSRGLMKNQMQAAARHLGNIFEKFTLDLANQTDYLEAPMTILPKKAEVRSDVQMSDDEKKLLSEVSRQSLYPKESAMEKQIDQAMKKLPKPTAQEALEKFRHNLEKPVQDNDGKEAAYIPGANTAEDIRRLDSSILSLREMKQRYENRNFFSRLLSPAARAERRAIATMEAQLQEKLVVSAKALTVLLDLENPLEEMADPTHFLGIRKREPDPPTFMENMKKAMETTMETTGEVIANVTNAVNIVLDAAANVEKGLIDQKDINIFEDLTEKDYEDDLFNRDFTDQQPEPEPKAPEEPKPQEEPQESYLGNLLTGAGMILGALNPLNLFSSEPEPEKVAFFSDDSPVVEEPSPMAQLDSKQAEVIRQLTAQGANLAGIYFDSMAKLLYFKTLEVAFNDKTLTPEQLEAGLTKESIDKNVRQIKTQPAFQNLEKLRARGLLTRAKNFVEDLRKDPNAINDVHKEYVLLQTDPAALENAKKAYKTAPAVSREAPAPEKEPVSKPPMIKNI